MSSHDDFITSLEELWSEPNGPLFRIRRGHFNDQGSKLILDTIKNIPMISGDVPIRLVSLLWYMPLFLEWQIERVEENGTDSKVYRIFVNQITNEIERILGIP
jgi:hypothetical protein